MTPHVPRIASANPPQPAARRNGPRFDEFPRLDQEAPLASVHMRNMGRLSSWMDDRGFGFITPDGGGERVYVHILSFAGRGRRPVQDDPVSYSLRYDAQGRPHAELVCRIDARDLTPRAKSVPVSSLVYAVAVAAVFLGWVVYLGVVGRLPLTIVGLYGAASALAYIVYWGDKVAAREYRWRTSESTLHLIGMVGGWPGALIARHALRHKTRKESFIFVFWITVTINCVTLGSFLYPTVRRSLVNLLS